MQPAHCHMVHNNSEPNSTGATVLTRYWCNSVDQVLLTAAVNTSFRYESCKRHTTVHSTPFSLPSRLASSRHLQHPPATHHPRQHITPATHHPRLPLKDTNCSGSLAAVGDHFGRLNITSCILQRIKFAEPCSGTVARAPLRLTTLPLLAKHLVPSHPFTLVAHKCTTQLHNSSNAKQALHSRVDNTSETASSRCQLDVPAA
jgi:hypothetical protein